MVRNAWGNRRPFLCGALSLFLTFTACALAEEPAAKSDAAAESAAADPYALPQTDKPEELLTFIGDLMKMRPPVKTRAQYFEHQNKLNAATLLATEKILAQKELPAETAISAAKIRALAIQRKANDPQEWDAAVALLTALPEHGQEEIAELKKNGQVQLRLTKAEQGRMDAAQLAELRAEVFVPFAAQRGNAEALRNVMRLGSYYERSKPDEAVKYLTSVIELLKNSENPSMAAIVPKLEGTIRRLQLLGNRMELKGTTLDGQSFDLSSLQGKVVLVDFWATWCGPCVAEMPHVKLLHSALREKGFEVVGISLDDDEDKLREFIKKHGISWVNLYPKDEEARGWKNPIATHYGISGIPTCILINAEGKVISLNARGKTLDDELTKIYGTLPNLQERAEDKGAAEKQVTVE